MNFFFGLTVLLYILSTIFYFKYIYIQKDSVHKKGFVLFLCGFICHTSVLGVGYVTEGHLPVQNLHETLSVFGWSIAAVFFFINYRFNLKVLGALVAPLSALSVGISTLIPDTPAPIGDMIKSIWVTIHVISTFLGNAAFAVAFAVGVLYLIQEHAIKSKKRGFFYSRLPSLDLLDQMGYTSVALGFPMLTFGIVTGCIYAQIIWGRYWSWDPKEVWSLITWLIYAALLHERLTAGWRGRRAAYFSILGFVILLFTFLGVNFFLKGHHGVFTQW